MSHENPVGPEAAATEVAVLGGGCFWCTEAVFAALEGVLRVESGYCGGACPAPSYEQVSSGTTGHAEVVRIEFDPARISFRQLLAVFFLTHDPTTLNRQGPDVGTQYRSVIFCQSPAQRCEAEAMLAELEAGRVFPGPIVTELAGSPPFWPAEDYHQSYFARNPQQPYCAALIPPKLEKLGQYFPEKLRRD
ncbi:peptide-methionine (S)-S-oxide reductase MsrA [Azovibrio restrictus]|uniref:peptide-methionine (S)-S-oxide reductase MsrA n=1 Tax=Azovibrio restrictus TaxID=146938 RepID=UPI0026EC0ECF|nr:peptide-methionine (S)-S-oxide reductase MsrA [Azovibrio restrictus]